MLQVNNLKNQRLMQENDWVFKNPTIETKDLIRKQIFEANVNKNMIIGMLDSTTSSQRRVFHHLTGDVSSNLEGHVANLDLVLKWNSIIFYEGDSATVVAGLDYLIFIFKKITILGRPISEREGLIFIPHLLKFIFYGLK
jgi:hypothetical protein